MVHDIVKTDSLEEEIETVPFMSSEFWFIELPNENWWFYLSNNLQYL